MVLRELAPDETALGAAALQALRPHLSLADIVATVNGTLRPVGYRLIGAFDNAQEAVVVAGFRENRALAWGHSLYVDDVSTLPSARGRGHGHGHALVNWLVAEAERLGCDLLHLDSGVGDGRAAAHRLYHRHHLQITSHHFGRPL